MISKNDIEEQIPVREVDTIAFLDVMKELVEDGKRVSITVAGNSMSPFLVDKRDKIFFEKPYRPLRVGDMAFYQRENGKYIMHRIYKIKKDGYYMVGDAQMVIEGPLPESCIFAVVTGCVRKGKHIGPEDFWWFFFEKIWIRLVPWRRRIMKAYRMLK